MGKTGGTIVKNLIVSIAKAFPQLLLAIGRLALNLITQLPQKFIEVGTGIMKGIVSGIKSAVGIVGKAFSTVLQPSKLATKAIDTVKKGWDKVIKQPAKKVYRMAQDKFDVVKSKAKAVWNQWKTNLAQKGSKLFSVTKKGFEVMVSAGKAVLNKWKDILKAKGSKKFQVIKKGFSTVLSAMKSVWSKWKEILAQASTKNFTVNKTTNEKTNKKRIGIREIPYDGYLAQLHKGEAVLTAAEANQYRKWINQQARVKDDSTNIALQTMGIDYNKLANVLIQSLSGMNINTAVNVNGRTIAKATAPFMKSEINTLERRSNRAYGVV